MISAIYIRNLGIFENIEVNFQTGFHVISGETGAGKSVFLQAVSFALGARADADWIRSGSEEASVTLQLNLTEQLERQKALEELGIPVEEGNQVRFRRTLHLSGRSKAYINDIPVSLKILQALGESWVQRVGQHAAHRLFSDAYLLKLLDLYAEAVELRECYQIAWREFRLCQKEVEDLRERETKAREQEEFLRFQWEELEKAQLYSGEEEELETKKQRLKHQVLLTQLSCELLSNLQEDDASVSDLLGKALGFAHKAQSWDPNFTEVATSLQLALEQVGIACRGIETSFAKLNGDPSELDRIEARLSRLADLKRKYRVNFSGLIEKREQWKTQIGELENFEELFLQKEKAKSQSEHVMRDVAKRLRESRLKAATRLGAHLEKVLKDLALPHAQIEFSFDQIEEIEAFREDGTERLHLLLSFNPGEEKRPLEEVASGGELSRLLLALYEILFPPEQFLTLVFDEVDAGVGGGIAELIGRKLERLSRRTQVFCVTHSPQIACHADWHFVIVKEVRQQRTFSQIKCLNSKEREQEIARMLAGIEITDQALKHAREMLRNAAA